MQYVDTRTFEKGLDKDTSSLITPPGFYRDALNVYNGTVDGDGAGALHAEKGNVLISAELPDGQNTTIEKCEDIERNAIIYFVHNDQGNHSIWMYIIGDPSPEMIMMSPRLNFRLNRKIIGANVLEGLLYWTDGYFNSYENVDIPGGVTQPDFNPPRKINIDRAMAGEYQDIDLQTMDRIKYPPWDAPKCEYFTDTDQAANFMYGFLFQFRYRYVYDDYERSVWSPISRTPLPPNIEGQEGRGELDSTVDNAIRLTVNSGHHTVLRVEVAARVGNSRPFGVFEQIDRDGIDDFTDIEVTFNNNEAKRILSSEENGKNYDRVPQICQDQELIQGNRLVDANIVEGYDVDIDLSRVVDGEIEYTTFTPSVIRTQIKEETELGIFSTIALGVGWNTRVTLPAYTQIAEGDSIVFTIGGSTYTYTSTGTFNSQQAFWNDLRVYLQSQGFVVTAIIDPSYTYMWFFFETLAVTSPLTSALFEPAVPFFRWPSWKTGTWHPFGFVYKDRAGRTASVVTSPEMKAYVPFYTEEAGLQSALYGDQVAQYRMDAKIVHTPPIWATHYSIVVRKNTRINSFAQLSVRTSSVTDGTDGDGNPDGSSTGRLRLSLDVAYQRDNTGAFIRHGIEEGDICRIITKGEDMPNPQFFLSEYKELRVTKFYPELNAIEVDFNGSMGDLVPGLGENGALVEIYRPRRDVDENDDLWLEIGQEHPVLLPHTEDRSHGFDPDILVAGEVDGTGALNITIGGGDVYMRTRKMLDRSVPAPEVFRLYWMEDSNFSDYFESDWHDYGRFHTLDKDARREELKTALRYSDVYAQNTRYNGLSSVDDGSFESVMDTHGPIVSITEVGYTLKVLQSQKITSIYLSRNVLFNADGSSNVSQSDAILGTKNPSETEYGTIHGTSVVRTDRHLYFFDAMNGLVLRDAANGAEVISDAGMSNYFSELASTYGADSVVYGGIDKDYDRYILTFTKNDGSIPSVTISFNTVGGFWISEHSWIPEMMGRRGNNFFSFKDGELWRMNYNELRNNYFGVQYDRRVSVVFNKEPRKVKSYHAISEESDAIWHAPEDGDITSLMAHNSGADITRIAYGRFKRKEGGVYAEIPRAINTVQTQDPIVNGRVIKGRALEASIRNEGSDRVYLLGVSVKYSSSERSGD